MESFLNGADGVAIISWKEGECEFGNGNMNTFEHVKFLKRLFSHLEVDKFIKSVEDITSKVEKLPPLPK